MVLAASILLTGVASAHAEQTCDDFKARLDEAMRTVRLKVDLTYRSADYGTEYLEGFDRTQIAIGCEDGVLTQFSGSAYDSGNEDFRKLGTAVVIAMGIEKSPRKAESIANRVWAKAAKASPPAALEEVRGFEIQTMQFPGNGGEQFRIDPPSP